MKLNKILFAIGLAAMVAGTANAASVNKKITLTAQINDAIYVSKPDGSSWYGTEELEANNHTQTAFSKTLPIRVWTKEPNFNVSLAQALKISSGVYEMPNAKVKITHGGGEGEVEFGKDLKITQTVQGNGGFDEIHNLNISVDAPTQVAGGPSTNGSYSGDLVMLFEPAP